MKNLLTLKNKLKRLEQLSVITFIA